MTMGALSLVSQPSTSTWKPKTMAMLIQNCARANTRVPDHRSRAMVASTARTASTVYSRIAGLRSARAAHGPAATGPLVGAPGHPPQRRQHPADGLVGQQAADRDDDEEDELLDRHAARQVEAGDVGRVVAPVVAPDADEVPDREDDDDGHECGDEQTRPAVDAGPQHELQGQGDRQAARHEEQVLVAIHCRVL